ncbi:hypothetical protein RsTz2092_07240 [Deferribacterales bacterium RsTz2092]|nr:hypothetical protein AGMMS49941_04130 [Deferribacterales bacterium]
MYKIKPIDDKELGAIKNSKEFALSDDINNTSKCVYSLVSDGATNERCAILDVRSVPDWGAPNYKKYMRIYYANRLLDSTITDKVALERRTTVLLGILTDVFVHIKSETDRTLVKIYADNDLELGIFTEMAKALQSEYEVRMYKRWIDIRRVI